MECLNCKSDALRGSDYCEACEKKELGKIGGWLYLPAISLILSIILYSMNGFRSLELYLDARHVLGNLANPVLLNTVLVFALVLFGIYVGSLFFRKRKALPNVYILWIIFSLLYAAGDLAIAYYALGLEVTSKDYSKLGRGIISACIWIPYFLVSVRVKRTFVH